MNRGYLNSGAILFISPLTNQKKVYLMDEQNISIYLSICAFSPVRQKPPCFGFSFIYLFTRKSSVAWMITDDYPSLLVIGHSLVFITCGFTIHIILTIKD